MISPHGTEHPHGTQDNPHGTHDIPHGTEHPHGTQDNPHGTHDIPPRYWTPPRYSRYPPTFIMISPHGTEYPPRYSRYPPRYWTPHGTEHPHGIAHTLYRVTKAAVTRIRFQIVPFSFRCVFKSIHFGLRIQMFAFSWWFSSFPCEQRWNENVSV